jgi:quercetin dioxygenase-like cupin family protein
MHAESPQPGSRVADPRPAPDPLRDRFVDIGSAARHLPRLLDGVASAADGIGVGETAAPALRRRLLERAGQSVRQGRGLLTVRRADLVPEHPAAGVRLEPLYRHADTEPLRPGEPLVSDIVTLEPGTRWTVAPGGNAVIGGAVPCAEEWLVLEGSLVLDGTVLLAQDFHRLEGGMASRLVAGANGMRALRRQALIVPDGTEGKTPRQRRQTQTAAEAPWVDFGPGILRRVLHAEPDGAAAMLYRTAPGATVPHHGHRHDEECFMVAGELFLDDLLLRQGEYQLAPAGSEHTGVFTDTGVVLYTHGDLELDLRVG